MATTESLREAIAAERRRREAFAEADLMAWVQEGQGQAALEALVFFATPGNFLSYAEQLRQEIRSGFNSADADKCRNCKKCTRDCPMSLDVHQMVQQGSMENSECILCGTCIDGCPKDVITYSFSAGDN